MLRKNMVFGVALVLALATIAVVTQLHARADASRDAQVKLARTETELNALQGLPWKGDPRQGGSPALAQRRMRASEQRIDRTLAGLRRDLETRALHTIAAPLRANFGALERVRALIAQDQQVRAGDVMVGIALRDLGVAQRALKVAGVDYEARASASLRWATFGSAAAIIALLGAFGFFYRRSVRARAAAVSALASLKAAQAERARLLAQTVRSAEQERMRVAAELHDGPVQHLAALGYALDRACRRLRNGDADSGLQHVERARTELTLEVVGLRRLMSELRPPVLDEGGLEAAIRDYAAGFGREHGLCCAVEADDPDAAALTPEIETVVYRVTQEALANVAKHARAERVRIRVLIGADAVELSIEDDGCGFDPASLPELVREGHFGLIGMRERVESVGGAWSLRSAPGRGTCVRVTLPAAPTPEAAEPFELALAS